MSLAPAAPRPGARGQCPWWWGSTTAPLPSLAVARTLPTAEVYSQDLGAMDYHVIGDAVWVCGVATNMNKEDATFEIVAEQYVSATRSSESFPTRCLIPDTPRFQNYKPILSKGKFVSVTGFLTGVERNDEKHFLLDVDQVVFLGQQPHSAPKAEHSPNKITSGTPARLKFTGFLGSQGTDTKSGEPSSKKRKTADDRAAEEANDKGEGTSSRSSPSLNKCIENNCRIVEVDPADRSAPLIRSKYIDWFGIAALPRWGSILSRKQHPTRLMQAWHIFLYKVGEFAKVQTAVPKAPSNTRGRRVGQKRLLEIQKQTDICGGDAGHRSGVCSGENMGSYVQPPAIRAEERGSDFNRLQDEDGFEREGLHLSELDAETPNIFRNIRQFCEERFQRFGIGYLGQDGLDKLLRKHGDGRKVTLYRCAGRNVTLKWFRSSIFMKASLFYHDWPLDRMLYVPRDSLYAVPPYASVNVATSIPPAIRI
ncbi:hypothetical protein B0H13DRAFT_1859046 [Mycena leptocephala]|nr:hypothetical protein B0H13DRAFT_1859046 [Mycena leptocephala]